MRMGLMSSLITMWILGAVEQSAFASVDELRIPPGVYQKNECRAGRYSIKNKDTGKFEIIPVSFTTGFTITEDNFQQRIDLVRLSSDCTGEVYKQEVFYKKKVEPLERGMRVVYADVNKIKYHKMKEDEHRIVYRDYDVYPLEVGRYFIGTVAALSINKHRYQNRIDYRFGYLDFIRLSLGNLSAEEVEYFEKRKVDPVEFAETRLESYYEQVTDEKILKEYEVSEN